MIKKSKALISLTLIIMMLTALVPAGTVVFAVGENDTTLSSLAYTYNGATTQITLTSGSLPLNRCIVELPHVARLLSANDLPKVSAIATNAGATVSVTDLDAFPGFAKVAVTAADGITKKNYYIRFKYASGVITDVIAAAYPSASTPPFKQFDDFQPLTLSELRDAVRDETATGWEKYNMLSSNQTITASSPISSTANTSRIPNETIAPEYLDSIASPTGWRWQWFVKEKSNGVASTTYFNGASRITSPYANDPRAQIGTGPWYTFTIDRPATVWVANLGSADLPAYSAADSGWTAPANPADYYLRLAPSTAGGDAYEYKKFWYKHFSNGSVTVPLGNRPSGTLSQVPQVFIVWDAPGAGDTSLSSLTVTINGVPQSVTVVPGQTNYRIMAPTGSSVSLDATLTDTTAEMLVSQPDPVTGITTIYVASGENTATYTVEVAGLSSDSSLKTLAYNHPMMGDQTIALTEGVTEYNVVLPYGISAAVPQIITNEVNYAYATIESVTQASALPGAASIVVKAEDGTTSTYTINFTVDANPPVVNRLPGTVTNVKTRNKSASTVQDTPVTAASTVYTVQGSAVVPLTKFDSTTGYMTDDERTAATDSPANLYFTSDKRAWAFGDRSVTAEYLGTQSNNPIRLGGQYVVVEGTSSVLLGDNVTKVLALNAEKDVVVPVPDFYSFNIDKGATVYLVTNVASYDSRFAQYGWAKQSGVQARRGAVTTVQGSNSLYYSVPNGTSAFSHVYAKRYSAGAYVTIPNRGAEVNNGMMIFVVWDECNTNTALSDLKMNDATITGFSPTKTVYDIELPVGATQVPTLAATPAFDGANVEVINPQSVPGTATINISAADGVTTGSYTVNYTVASLPAPEVVADDVSNTVIGLDLATMEYAVSTDDGVSYGNYTSDVPVGFGSALKVKVRFKATETAPASNEIILTFTINAGDINNDGLINISDVVMAAEIAVGYTYTPEQIARANVSDKDNALVDIADVLLILERTMGAQTLFPVEASPTPYVILKLDDLRDTNTAAFAAIADIAEQEEIKVSFGVIGNTLEDNGLKQSYYDTIKGWITDGIEIWHHGYSHTQTEYNAASYEDQKTSFQKTVDLLSQKCDYTVRTFGSPYNNSDGTTVQLMNNDFPQIKVSMLAPDPNSEANQLKLNTRSNMEVSVGVLGFSYFVENYNNNTASPYVVLQGHPASWTEKDIVAFKNIISFLKSKGATFVTPYEYYQTLQPAQ